MYITNTGDRIDAKVTASATIADIRSAVGTAVVGNVIIAAGCRPRAGTVKDGITGTVITDRITGPMTVVFGKDGADEAETNLNSGWQD